MIAEKLEHELGESLKKIKDDEAKEQTYLKDVQSDIALMKEGTCS